MNTKPFNITDIDYELNMDNYNLRYVLKEYLGRDITDDDTKFTLDEAERFLNFILLSEKFKFITIKSNRRYVDFIYEKELSNQITEAIKEKILSKNKVTFDLLTTQRVFDIARLIKHEVHNGIDYNIKLSYLAQDNNQNPIHYEGIFTYEEFVKIKNDISIKYKQISMK